MRLLAISVTATFALTCSQASAQIPGLDLTPIGALVDTFKEVCVDATDGADARSRARALDGVSLLPKPEDGFSPYDQRFRYRLMTLGVLGYRDAPVCFVTANVVPDLSPEVFEESISAGLGTSGHFRKRRDFQRAEWSNDGRRFMAEFGKRSDGHTTALLSLRNR